MAGERFFPHLLIASFLLLACKNEGPLSPASDSGTSAAPAIRVAAASDLTSAFDAVGKAFQEKSGHTLSFTFGSSGLLAKQLREGAPFDVFAAANVSFVKEAVAAGACDGATSRVYAQGHLALWSLKHARRSAPQSLQDLADPAYVRIAIANPEHAPYGQAAREALTAAGLWSKVQPRLVFGENIRQTLQLAQTGNAEAAIVAQSLVLDDTTGLQVAIDPALHAPINQALVVCTKGPNTQGGRAFAAFLTSGEGQTLLRHFGFGIPSEEAGKVSP